jgi:hypothetical protein
MPRFSAGYFIHAIFVSDVIEESIMSVLISNGILGGGGSLMCGKSSVARDETSFYMNLVLDAFLFMFS